MKSIPKYFYIEDIINGICYYSIGSVITNQTVDVYLATLQSNYVGNRKENLNNQIKTILLC